MGKNVRYANGYRRRKLRQWLKAQGRPCEICGGSIDYTLPPNDPWAFEVDEIIPVALGGDPLDKKNVQAAHRICNEKRGKRLMSELKTMKLPPRPTTDW